MVTPTFPTRFLSGFSVFLCRFRGSFLHRLFVSKSVPEGVPKDRFWDVFAPKMCLAAPKSRIKINQNLRREKRGYRAAGWADRDPSGYHFDHLGHSF